MEICVSGNDYLIWGWVSFNILNIFKYIFYLLQMLLLTSKFCDTKLFWKWVKVSFQSIQVIDWSQNGRGRCWTDRSSTKLSGTLHCLIYNSWLRKLWLRSTSPYKIHQTFKTAHRLDAITQSDKRRLKCIRVDSTKKSDCSS